MDFSQDAEAFSVGFQAAQAHVCRTELQVKGQRAGGRGLRGELGEMAAEDGVQLLIQIPFLIST